MAIGGSAAALDFCWSPGNFSVQKVIALYVAAKSARQVAKEHKGSLQPPRSFVFFVVKLLRCRIIRITIANRTHSEEAMQRRCRQAAEGHNEK